MKPEMRCVWDQAFAGSQRMRRGKTIDQPLPPIDHRLWGRSSWLAVARGDHKRMDETA